MFKNNLSKFKKWKILNSRNIDSTLAINIKNFSIQSNGTYELCMQVQNRSNKTVNRYKGLIIIMDNYYDTIVAFNFLSDKMSEPYVNNTLFTPFDYIDLVQPIANCTRFLNAPIAPNEWIEKANGRNIYANDERIKFLINTIVFEDGTVLKRP